MKLNPQNDVYTGDLGILNARKQMWAKGETASAKYRYASYVILAIGLAMLIYVGTRTTGGTTMMSQLPLHLTVWVTALAAFLMARRGKRTAERPFNGFHNARFEVDDDTVYYVYQQGMALYTYYIHDNDIHRITRDDESGVLIIEGPAKINKQTRNGDTETDVDEFWALVPFDKYDLDDLLAPYKKKVKAANGKLRQRYIDEHQEGQAS